MKNTSESKGSHWVHRFCCWVLLGSWSVPAGFWSVPVLAITLDGHEKTNARACLALVNAPKSLILKG